MIDARTPRQVADDLEFELRTTLGRQDVRVNYTMNTNPPAYCFYTIIDGVQYLGSVEPWKDDGTLCDARQARELVVDLTRYAHAFEFLRVVARSADRGTNAVLLMLAEGFSQHDRWEELQKKIKAAGELRERTSEGTSER
jgi:hypothetical protein